jgi:hypothetical protein
VRDSWRMAREVFRIRRRVEGIAGEVDHF